MRSIAYNLQGLVHPFDDFADFFQRNMGKLKPQGPNVRSINHHFHLYRCLEEIDWAIKGPPKKTNQFVEDDMELWDSAFLVQGLKKMSVSGGVATLQMIDVNLTVRHKAGRVYKTKNPYIHFPTIHRMAFSENSFRMSLKTSFFQQLKPTCPPS